MSHAAGTTIEQAARSIFVIETTDQQPQAENAAFERMFADPRQNRFIGRNPPAHTIHGYILSDVILDGGFNGLWNVDGFIRGSSAQPEDALLRVAIDQRHLIRSDESSTLIIGCNHAYDNYFHWITQALPAIDSSFRRDGQARTPTLGLPPLQPWQEETLALLGYGQTKRLTLSEPSAYYAFKRVELNEFLTGGGALCNSAVAYRTFSRMREEVPSETAPGTSTSRDVIGGGRIYVARTDTTRRRMRNEPALLEEMRRRGFEIVVPGELPVAEQIRVFRAASLVVGPHGAGLTNIAFCEPGTIVYELLPKPYGNLHFYNLGQICRLRYWMDAFDSVGEGQPGGDDWDADLDIIKSRLDEIDTVRTAFVDAASRRPIGAMDFLRGQPGQLPHQRIAAPPAPEDPAPRPGLFSRVFGQRR